jgi:hypothetical protein
MANKKSEAFCERLALYMVRTMKHLLILLTVYPCLAQIPYADTELSFHAMCAISGIRSPAEGSTATWSDRCTLESMPASGGLRTRVRILVTLSAGSPVATNMAPVADYVKSEATLSGDIVITSLLWGKITISPTYPEIRASVTQRAPAFEIRPQVLNISLLDPSTLEIRVEESWGDFDGKNPSSDWQLRQGDSFQLLSHIK